MNTNRTTTRMAPFLRLGAVLAATGLFAPTLQAQECDDLSGDWNLTITLPDATTQQVTLTLEQDGCDLAGMIKGNNETPIEDGKAEGSTFTFNVTVTNQADGQQLDFAWEGTRDGDSIAGTWSSEMAGSLEFTGTKSGGP